MFDPEGRIHVVCPQCRALVLLCDTLSRMERQKIAAMRLEEPVAAMETLKTMLPCGDREAKAIVVHLRKPGEGCSYCGAVMPHGALLCAECMSVNLDWT
jgi:hypothetical protein